MRSSDGELAEPLQRAGRTEAVEGPGFSPAASRHTTTPRSSARAGPLSAAPRSPDGDRSPPRRWQSAAHHAAAGSDSVATALRREDAGTRVRGQPQVAPICRYAAARSRAGRLSEPPVICAIRSRPRAREVVDDESSAEGPIDRDDVDPGDADLTADDHGRRRRAVRRKADPGSSLSRSRPATWMLQQGVEQAARCAASVGPERRAGRGRPFRLAWARHAYIQPGLLTSLMRTPMARLCRRASDRASAFGR